jgi:sigma-E factor negative regulatory protein RseA
MTDSKTDQSDSAALVSAAMDGDSRAVDAVAAAWKDPNSRVRADWHAYQLIGDVLRSADGANPASRDEALLQRVRQRLANEPVVLAPKVPTATIQHSSRRWWAPAAVAAGLMAVVGLVVLQPVQDAGSSGAPLAARGGALQPVSQSAVSPRETLVAAPAPAVASGAVMIRNAELDRYLAAHGQFSATSAVPAPGLAVRNVSTVAPSR